MEPISAFGRNLDPEHSNLEPVPYMFQSADLHPGRLHSHIENTYKF